MSRNPLRSEAAAFRLLLLTLVAFAAIALAAVAAGTVAALVVWPVVSALAVAGWARGRRGRPLPSAPAHVGGPDERRILVVAPTLASRLRRLASDLDRPQAQARERAAAAAETLRAPNVVAAPVVGEDPVAAVEDALRTFGGDEIVVLPGDDALVERLRERFALPVSQSSA